MYFDGASKTDEKGCPKSGVGIVFITPEGNMIPHSFTLSESCSNNVSEYTALIMGMELARDIKVHQLEVRGNSKLVINQMNGVYEVRKPDILPYHTAASELARTFAYFNIEHVPRGQNTKADADASLAASLSLPEGESMTVMVYEKRILPPLNTYEVG
jgi:ribonuclease HI